MPKTVEILLKELRVQENGEIPEGEARNLLHVALAYPGPGHGLVSTTKVLKLRDNQTIDFAGGTDEATGERYSFTDRVLFKEAICGRCTLVVQLTAVQELSFLERVLQKVFGTAFQLAWAAVTKGVGNVFLGRVAESAAALHLGSLKTEDAVDVIGAASLDLDAAALPAPGAAATDAALDLKAPRAVVQMRARFNPNTHQPERVPHTLLAAGQVNGRLTLELRVVD
jgi:hypothetical protein